MFGAVSQRIEKDNSGSLQSVNRGCGLVVYLGFIEAVAVPLMSVANSVLPVSQK